MLQLSFVNFKKGTFLLIEGKAESDRFFIIQSGNVRCFKAQEVPGSTPTLLGPGDFIGVIPCMSSHSQIETVTALTDVTAISVRRDQYPDLISKNTPVAMKIIRTFSQRMRIMNELLAKLTLKNVVSDSPEHIYDVATYYEKRGNIDIATYAYYQFLKTCKGAPTFDAAKQKFLRLKPHAKKAAYFEPTTDLVRNYPKDTMIFSECQSGQDMFIIQGGQVKISKVVEGNEVTFAVLKKGDMFGEMALLENKPRSASAIAHEDCQLMVVNRQNFDQMVSTQPQLIARLTTTFAERLWSMYRQLDNACLVEPVAKFIDMLALQIEKSKMPLQGKVQLQTDLSLTDLANMCGIPQDKQPTAIFQFQNDPHIKIVSGKILIKDCVDTMKQADFYRKQQAKNDKNK